MWLSEPTDGGWHAVRSAGPVIGERCGHTHKFERRAKRCAERRNERVAPLGIAVGDAVRKARRRRRPPSGVLGTVTEIYTDKKGLKAKLSSGGKVVSAWPVRLLEKVERRESGQNDGGAEKEAVE
jgi:hypothetical protein